MYDPWRPRGMSPHDLETMPIDAVDLTDVDTAYDDMYQPTDDLLIASDASSSSQFYQYALDLTRFGSYMTPEQEPTASEISSALRTPISAVRPAYQYPNHYASRELDLVSPTPPTPIPHAAQFQIFDLTCFIEDGAGRSQPESTGWRNSRSTTDSSAHLTYLLASPRSGYAGGESAGQSRSWRNSTYTLASPSQDYNVDYCPTANDPLDVDMAFMEDQIRESAVVVHTHPQPVLIADEEDFSTSTDGPTNIDMFATDCKYDTCSDHMFDRLCRGMKPADTGTVAPSVTKIERDEIRSCGTLPPDKHEKVKKKKSRSKSCGRQSKKKKKKPHPEPRRNKSFHASSARPTKFQELPALVDNHPVRGRRRTVDDTTEFDDQFFLKNDTQYRDKNCSRTSLGERSAKSGSTAATLDSIADNSVVERRQWMGQFVCDLFNTDQSKAIFYASSIAEANASKDKGIKKKKGQTVGDFHKVKDYCDFVLQNLDLADILENIDAGMYDDHLDDFQEDIELSLEAAMDKHDTFIEYENRKWNSKFREDEHSMATRQRHQNLRLLAGEELMKQLDADFRMQLLEHFCHQISRRQQITKKPQQQGLHKRQLRLRQ